MSRTMLYRLDQKPGGEPIAIEGLPCWYKIFADEDVEAANEAGWLSHARIREFILDDLAGKEPGRKTEGDPETLAELYARIEGMDEPSAKVALDEWADTKGIKLDRRNKLDSMKEVLEKALADGE